MAEPNKIELAWAAGLFDGEGNCRRRKKTQGRGRQTPLLSIAQVDTSVLNRLKEAVRVGKIYGPYLQRNRPTTKPYWVYATPSFSESMIAVAFIWNLLSPIKKAQIKEALEGLYRTPVRKPGPKKATQIE